MTKIKISAAENSALSSIDLNNVPFGQQCTDHMAVADYQSGAWVNFEIKPVERLSLHPSNLTLHYGQAIFEGMKASVTTDGQPLLFRPGLHAERFNASARRMCMPEFPEDMFVEMIDKLVSIDRDWIPPVTGSSLYIRPFMIATDEYLGVTASQSYKFMILTLPAGPYYARPIALTTSTEYVRAVEGGAGEAKCAGNYGASLYPAGLARQAGYDQVLWLDAHEFKYVQEVGTMNIFFVFKDTVVTPATTGTILKGLTRRSVIEILTDKGIPVEERALSIDEVFDRFNTGELVEVFGTGTAALVANVAKIHHAGALINFGADRYSLSNEIRDIINSIRDGSMADKYGWTVPVKESVLV